MRTDIRARHIWIASGFLIALLPESFVAEADPGSQAERTLYLMGTRVSLVARAAARSDGMQRLEVMVTALERAEAELSTWRQDSAISQFNRQPIGQPWHASAELCRLFEQLEAWQGGTRGAFDPAIGSLIDAWDIHGHGVVPDDRELARARAHSGWDRIRLDRRWCTLTRTAGVRIDVGGFGKGAALDRVRASVAPGAPWLIDLGGQVMAGGESDNAPAWRVGIAHPRDRLHAIGEIELREGSLATSAGSERDLVVRNARIGHVLDPRTGRPVTRTGSVIAWHASALTADILSTALYVMGSAEGLAWAEAQGLAVCFLDTLDRDSRAPVIARCSPAFNTRFKRFGALAAGSRQKAGRQRYIAVGARPRTSHRECHKSRPTPLLYRRQHDRTFVAGN